MSRSESSSMHDVSSKTSQKINLDSLSMRVIKRRGETVFFDRARVEAILKRCAQGLEGDISIDLIIKELIRNIYDGVSTENIEKALILSVVALLEKDPAYNVVASRLFLQRIYKEVIGASTSQASRAQEYKKAFISGIKKGVEAGRLNPTMADFPLEQLAEHLVIERDDLLRYRGIATLYERYFLRLEKDLIELPQAFWMRVAMGLALKEEHRLERAVEFYNTLSQLNYVSGTPTLFHSGTVHSQLSSCFLTYVDDDLNHIFKCLHDNAMLAKFSGGVGNDWTPLRATGSIIKSINVESQGVVPFLKIANDVVAAINRSGSRRGAQVVYLETWHYDIEDFLDLRRNTGDERRRTHEMNTANWIPDLFMKRVLNNENWTLFSPNDVPDLHDKVGKAFEEAYCAYEAQAARGEIRLFKIMPAAQLWRKMLSRLFETGHPWICFKDPCNLRSPQDHCGVVHSSNLCTEITLNTSREETAVCNLGSINLAQCIKDKKLDTQLLEKTINTAVRMLDNTIDVNFYPTKEAHASNMRHRPLGLGIMGLQDALFMMDLPFEDEKTLEFADLVMETVSYYAILASSKLAKERGAYESYKGSKWDRNIFPIDTLEILEQERGMKIEVDRVSRLDWTPVREYVRTHGLRNSNIMAIAPTATISNISGCFPCIEPVFKNMYVKVNMSGDFAVINEFLVADLKKLGLWNQEMVEQIKYYDGSIQMIDEIPDILKKKYKESFEIDPLWLLKLTALRGKWIDQSQSHNVFMSGVSGKLLNDIYVTAWKYGLKTTYYLRTLGASQIEKSTLDAKKFGFTQKRQYSAQAKTETTIKACSIEDTDCESCQ